MSRAIGYQDRTSGDARSRIRLGVIMNGVTGRMGTNQHLIRSILAIRADGGVPLADGTVIWPDPILVGRSEPKLRALAAAHGIERWSTDLDACFEVADDSIYFDAQTTRLRPGAVLTAIAAGKHVYCEKPIAEDLDTALDLTRRARTAGVRAGVVQDKLWLPGLVKLRRLVESGFFGRMLSLRVEFGYWVFEGDRVAAQRPSWNYRSADGGGIILDMFSHWRYVLESIAGPVRSVLAVGATHIPERVDEAGRPYACTAEDAAYAIVRLEGDVIAQVNSSWCTRVRRDDLLTVHVDGTLGSAVAGLRDCRVQHRVATPVPVWNPDIPQEIDFHEGWQLVPDQQRFDNAFRAQWEAFLRHVGAGAPFPWDFLAGARGVQLAEAAHRSWREGRWVDVRDLAP